MPSVINLEKSPQKDETKLLWKVVCQNDKSVELYRVYNRNCPHASQCDVTALAYRYGPYLVHVQAATATWVPSTTLHDPVLHAPSPAQWVHSMLYTRISSSLVITCMPNLQCVQGVCVCISLLASPTLEGCSPRSRTRLQNLPAIGTEVWEHAHEQNGYA